MMRLELKKLGYGGLILLLAGAASAVSAAEAPRVEFATGKYADNARMKRVLSIPGADGLIVSVSGETEKDRDLLRIYDKDIVEIKRLSGPIQEKFTVSGDTITVTFNADGRTTKNGATVRIAAVSPMEEYDQIKGRLIGIINAVATNGAQAANQELSKNSQKVQELPAKLETAKPDAETIRQVVDGLSSLSNSYAAISGMRDSVAAKNKEQFDALEKIQAKTAQYREKLRKKKYAEENELSNMRNSAASERQSTERRKLEISIAAKDSIIKSLETQIKVWGQFHKTQADLLEKLQIYNEKLGLLFYSMGVNTEVYREAAHVLQLRRNMENTLQTLDGLATLTDVIAEIETAWSEIEAIRVKLSNADIMP
jgi:hypothetical protein